ncbi:MULTISPECIES: efflux transporter outer membrane subunit [Burkholderiaceae]|uniref:Multidrug transporter n=1 Tax=Paraburkholderia aromaticivorans TaxID=2026199 RepID=A0A248VZ70_9BURK|nr:efflux transporter outer membrane subunit [Paraburkholderia aromaticivorans]ASW04346.1 multidrug transporter [Paraburkholderia aromaticivorans]
MKPVRLITLGAAVMMAGCTMIPNYHRPDASVATGYSASDGMAANPSAAADIEWRDFYREPHLQKLIAFALDNNRDLRVSILNIEAARAQYQIQRADLLPTLSATAGSTVQRQPADLSMTGQSGVSHSYSVGGAVASYELDLFGRVRSLSQSALETYLATAEARKAAQISLVAEVANAWLTLQADLELRTLTSDTLANQQASYKIVKANFNAGTSSALDLSQAETQVRSAEANLAQYDRQARQDVNALTLLVGAPVPADLVTAVRLDTVALDDGLAAGLPSDLLSRRPDIVAAEHQLKSANANIGAARAAFFPRIALTASGGTASASLHNLFDAGSSAWAFGPSISVPIFDYGRNKANLDVARVTTKIEVATYQKAIQTAFRDVSDALDGRDTYVRQQAAQVQLVQASASAYRLSGERYQQGVDDYLSVLVNQRSLYDAQQTLVKVQLARAENTVGLYRALGGGWKDASAADAAAAGAPSTSSDS